MMFLSKRAAKGLGFSHPLSKLDLPFKLSDERLAHLVSVLRDRTITQSERDELARGHIRLALDVVGRYLTRAPHKRDSLVAEALFGVAYAISQAPLKLKDSNFTGYCVGCIHRFVVAELLESHEGAVPHSTYSRRKKAGKSVNGVRFSRLEDEQSIPDPSDLFDMEEALEHCIKNDFERKVIEGRREGKSDEEIGNELGYSKAWIGQIRGAVASRFERQLCR